jgi:hypothetical protein
VPSSFSSMIKTSSWAATFVSIFKRANFVPCFSKQLLLSEKFTVPSIVNIENCKLHRHRAKSTLQSAIHAPHPPAARQSWLVFSGLALHARRGPESNMIFRGATARYESCKFYRHRSTPETCDRPNSARSARCLASSARAGPKLPEDGSAARVSSLWSGLSRMPWGSASSGNFVFPLRRRPGLHPLKRCSTLTLRAESAARTAPFARGRDTETLNSKTRLEGRVCIPARNARRRAC